MGTYYGGSQEDIGYACATDNSGGVYLVGKISSDDGIASSGYQNTYAGSTPCPSNYYGDAFLVKFNDNGVRQWSTYYGGGADDEGRSCAVDNSGNIYLAETSRSSANISWNGRQNSNGGGQDAYMVKFNSLGVRQWATYFWRDRTRERFCVCHRHQWLSVSYWADKIRNINWHLGWWVPE